MGPVAGHRNHSLSHMLSSCCRMPVALSLLLSSCQRSSLVMVKSRRLYRDTARKNAAKAAAQKQAISQAQSSQGEDGSRGWFDRVMKSRRGKRSVTSKMHGRPLKVNSTSRHVKLVHILHFKPPHPRTCYEQQWLPHHCTNAEGVVHSKQLVVLCNAAAQHKAAAAAHSGLSTLFGPLWHTSHVLMNTEQEDFSLQTAYLAPPHSAQPSPTERHAALRRCQPVASPELTSPKQE